MTALYTLLIFLLFIMVTNTKFLSNLKDPFTVNINFAKTCYGENQNRFDFHLQTRKFNRTHLGADVNATSVEPFDQTYQIEIEVRRWGDGGWKRNFVHLKQNNACNSLYLIFGKIWEKVALSAGANKGCPIQPGFFHIDNYFVDLTTCQLVLQRGRFHAIVKIWKNNEVYLCLEAEVDVI